MSPLDPERIISILKEFANSRRKPLQILLIGGLALYFYGMRDRATLDIDAEVKGDLEDLFHFLKSHQVPADLSENISGWSVVAMPPGYRERAQSVYEDSRLKIKVLSPLDFIMAKLRRFTEVDIADALCVTKKYNVHSEEVRKMSEQVIQNSPKDTALFLFRDNVGQFIKMIRRNEV